MLTFRTRIFIIVGAVVLLLAVIGVVLFISAKNKQAASPTAGAQTPATIDQANFTTDKITPTAAPVPPGVTPKPLTTEETMKNAALQTARIFTERYGTYSSDSDFANIREVKSLVTSAFWSELSKKMTGQPSGSFVGMTTLAVAADLAVWNVDKAEAEITCQRTETKNNATDVLSQKARVHLVKSGDGWLVDGFEWK